jgi:predicted GNAT family acetyltransferase
MEVLQEDNGKKGKFFIMANNIQAAEMTYTWAGAERIIIDHTEVSDVLRGQSAGKKMVMHAVTFAREKRIKIIPLCPFANSMFQKIEEIRDVL